MGDGNLRLPFCTIVAMDTTNICYRACRNCEKVLPDKGGDAPAPGGIECQHCRLRPFNRGVRGSKRVYRILLSVATENKVVVAICFDRASQVLMGCSADEFFEFASANPFAVETAGSILEGEMFQMVLRKPNSGNAQHMRIDSILPLASKFRPVMEHLKNFYQAL